MSRRANRMYYGNHEGTPYIGAYAPTKIGRSIAEQALRSVMTGGEMAVTNLVTSPNQLRMLAKADTDLTPQETIDYLNNYGQVLIVDNLKPEAMARFVGQQATEQLLGKRIGS